MLHKNIIIRKTHRYLGLFIGIQLLIWTASGLYFSWTDIDKIRGDHFKNPDYKMAAYSDLVSLAELNTGGIRSIELVEINNKPFYWINGSELYNATTGQLKNHLTKNEAISVVEQQLIPSLKVKSVEAVYEAGQHHEVRNKPLPAYAVRFEGNHKLRAYVSMQNGKLISLRHEGWRLFDFLWMTHTMDYKSRDNFNTFTLRAFSLLGLLTVLSGFLLWMVSSRLFRKNSVTR